MLYLGLSFLDLLLVLGLSYSMLLSLTACWQIQKVRDNVVVNSVVLITLPGTIVVHRSPGGTMGYLGAADETHGQDLQSTTEEDGTEPTRVGLIYGL